MRIKKIATRIGITVTLMLASVTGVNLVGAEPASAASSSCYGDYCSGRDPVTTTGVDGVPCYVDAQTVQTVALVSPGGSVDVFGVSVGFGGETAGTVNLRWSERCGTNWATLNLSSGANIRALKVAQNTGYTQRTQLLRIGYTTLAAGLYHTPMIYSRDHACQAIVELPAWGSASTQWA